VFLAIWAVIAVDGVLGDHRLDLFRNVFDHPRPRSSAALQLALTVRTTLEAMRFPLVDSHGLLATNALVADAGTGFLAATFRFVGLGVDRHHARRRRWGSRSVAAFEPCQRGTLLTDAPTHCQRGQGDGFAAELVELPRQRFIELPTQRSVNDPLQFSCRPWLHAL